MPDKHPTMNVEEFAGHAAPLFPDNNWKIVSTPSMPPGEYDDYGGDKYIITTELVGKVDAFLAELKKFGGPAPDVVYPHDENTIFAEWYHFDTQVSRETGHPKNRMSWDLTDWTVLISVGDEPSYFIKLSKGT